MDHAGLTVKLRSISEETLLFWRELISQPETREHQPLQEWTEDELRRQLSRYSENDLGHPLHREYKWVVIDAVSREPVGVVSFGKLDIGQKIGRIGYSLHPSWWGKGFGASSVGAMVKKYSTSQIVSGLKQNAPFITRHLLEYWRRTTSPGKVPSGVIWRFDGDEWIITVLGC
jgi:hypothetical protein